MTVAAAAVIRTGALHNNLRIIRQAAPGCAVLAVIKANAYGHGLVNVAALLPDADGFAVARIDEAIQLRDAGISKRIVVLGGFVTADEARLAACQRLDMVIHGPEQVSQLESLPELPPLSLWLKVDTGMGRLGADPESVAGILARLRACAAGRGELRLMTHLAAADEAGHAGTQGQLDCFTGLLRGWHGEISIANSAAILQWPASCATGGMGQPARNWIRPGLMLYGASPLPGHTAASLGLQPVMSFESRIIAVRQIPRGRGVGYGGDWVAPRDSLVGVASVGYADGYPWHSATRTPVLVNGSRAVVIGRVSMDMVSIDLTGLPPVSPGDRVVLWGDGLPVEEVAACAGTISYELLAGMSPRVVRQVEG